MSVSLRAERCCSSILELMDWSMLAAAVLYRWVPVRTTKVSYLSMSTRVARVLLEAGTAYHEGRPQSFSPEYEAILDPEDPDRSGWARAGRSPCSSGVLRVL